jgi:hypothetical protein
MNSHLEITELLKKKQARRRRLAKLSFEEKNRDHRAPARIRDQSQPDANAPTGKADE